MDEFIEEVPKQDQEDKEEAVSEQPRRELITRMKEAYSQLRPDLSSFVLLFVLYLFQGIFLYYFDPSLQIDFLRQGARFT